MDTNQLTKRAEEASTLAFRLAETAKNAIGTCAYSTLASIAASAHFAAQAAWEKVHAAKGTK